MPKAKSRKSKTELRIAKVMDYKKVFGSQQGKRVLYDLMDSSFVMRNTFDRNLQDKEHFFREGQRAVVLRILTVLETSEEEFHKLLRDADNASSVYR